MSQGKIVLYSPRPDPTWGPVYAPLPLLSIAAIPYSQSYEIKIRSWMDKETEKQIIEDSVDAICLGITAMTGYQILDGLRIAAMFKSKFPDVPIVWGGWHPSLLPEQTVRHPYVDIVVRGQGERTFAEVVEALKCGSSLANIPGVTYKDNGKILHNPSRALEDVNNFPRLPFELIDAEKYIFEHSYLGPRTIHYITSQGCPYQCGFCSEVSVNKRRWTGLSAERVLSDAKFLVERYGITGLAIVDSNFFTEKERIRKICEGVLEDGVKVNWGDLNGRTAQLARYDRELWSLMEACGFKVILVGSESGDSDVLVAIDKHTSVEDTYRFAKKCKEHDIKVFFSNLVGVPRPNLKSPQKNKIVDKEIWATISMIDRLYSLDKRHRFLIFPYAPYPGTPLYAMAQELGFEPPGELKEWGDFTLYESKIPWVSKKQMRLISMLQYLFLFLDPDSEKILESVRNKLAKFLGSMFLKLFRFISRKRWEAKFFKAPLDLWLYWFIRRYQRWI